jgi:hypothetical protein
VRTAEVAAAEESPHKVRPSGQGHSRLVPNQGVGDLVGAVRHRAADVTALLPAGPQLLTVAAGGRIGMPQTVPQGRSAPAAEPRCPPG